MSDDRILFTIEQIAVRCGAEITEVERLVQVGVIDPDPEHPDRFRPETTLRIQRALRIETDLGVNPEGVAVILDLLDYIDRLERGLR